MTDSALPPSIDSAETAAIAPALAALLSKMREQGDFPALSDSVARIQKVADSENDSLSDLTHEILKDVALTNKLLRLVNSVHYAHASRGTISTVSRAVSLVGFQAVRNLALSLVLLDHLHDKAHASQMREEFLRAMMAGSIAAELCVGHDAEEAFIGAMFQNLGRMLCEFYFPAEAAQIRNLVAAGRYAGGENAAALQVLGMGLEDLGVGVARQWGLPDTLQRCMRRPMGDPLQRRPEQGAERLRWAAMAANDMAALLLQTPSALVAPALEPLAQRFVRVLGMPADKILEATDRGRQRLVALAQTLDLAVAPGSRAARLLQTPSVDPEQPVVEDALAPLELRQTEPPVLAGMIDWQAPDNSPSAALVNEVLAAGVQDITNAMVENFQLNDVLRMILETMFRALGFRRMVFCLRDPRSDTLVGRLGLGEGSDAAVRAMRVPLQSPDDLFAVVCRRGADTLIGDATQERIQSRLPDWYRQRIAAPTFLLLPLKMKGQPFALIYADQAMPGGIVVDEKVLGLLGTLRNQAVMAFRQAG